jgi:hypothetical protein
LSYRILSERRIFKASCSVSFLVVMYIKNVFILNCVANYIYNCQTSFFLALCSTILSLFLVFHLFVTFSFLMLPSFFFSYFFSTDFSFFFARVVFISVFLVSFSAQFPPFMFYVLLFHVLTYKCVLVPRLILRLLNKRLVQFCCFPSALSLFFIIIIISCIPLNSLYHCTSEAEFLNV